MLLRAVAMSLLLGDALFVGVHLAAANLGAGHLDPDWLLVHRWRLALFGAVVDVTGGALVAAGAADLAGAVGGQLQGALGTPLPEAVAPARDGVGR